MHEAEVAELGVQNKNQMSEGCNEKDKDVPILMGRSGCSRDQHLQLPHHPLEPVLVIDAMHERDACLLWEKVDAHVTRIKYQDRSMLRDRPDFFRYRMLIDWWTSGNGSRQGLRRGWQTD